MNERRVEIVAVKEECCGTDTCCHTAIEHSDHIGWLVDGRLRCRTRDTEPLFECSLSFDSNLQCQVVAALDGHIHGPQCGHEQVPHGNHVDYLVGERLHHVVGTPNTCCERKCIREVLKSSTVVDHGHVHIKRRAGTSSQRHTDTDQEPLLNKSTTQTDIFAAGICCPSEAPVIHKILENLPGVVSVEVTVLTKNVHVEHDPSITSPAVLLSALNGAGLQASIGKRGKQTDSASMWPPIHVALSGIFLLISLFAFVSPWVDWLEYVALASVGIGCPLILMRAVASIRQLLLDINVLMIIACIGAIALQEFYEAAAIIFLFGISQWLEDLSMSRARNAVCCLQELQPETAVSAETGESVPVGKIRIDDLLLVRPGDRVPVDGTVLSGSSAVNESLLTGESKPVAKKEGDNLLSGSVNSGSGSLRMRSTSRASDSTISQLAKKVEEATQQRSNTQRAVETFATFYTPLVVFGAALVAVLPLLVHSMDWSEWFKTSLVLMVTACPCALVISTPVTTICGISRAAQMSILIKGGSALETLSSLKAITFDKTGTLTEGNFNVVEIRKFGEMCEAELLNWAASIEVHSSHPLAAAIIGSAAAQGHHHGSQATSVEDIPGGGLTGHRDGVVVSVGNLGLMIDRGCAFTGSKCSMKCLDKEVGARGQKACFVAVDSRVVGVIIVADAVRPTAKTALDALRAMKLQLGLLTGDASVAAQYIASTVGIEPDHIHSGLIPEDKEEILKTYRERYGSVGHVGDGVNDSLALASSDVGIAMGVGGSTMAVEAADVALFSNEISSIVTAIRLSQAVRTIIYQNIVFAVSVKVAVIVLAFVSDVRLWHAVIADVGSALLVTMNGLRVLRLERKQQEHLQNQQQSCCAQKRCQTKTYTTESKDSQGSSCCAHKQKHDDNEVTESKDQPNKEKACCSKRNQQSRDLTEPKSCCSSKKQSVLLQ